jgi:serine/threonine protein kinase
MLSKKINKHTNKKYNSNKKINYKNKLKTSKKRININKLSLKGGKYLDKGGFGCVVRPAIPCSNISYKDKNTNFNNYVSKIISKPKIKDINEEIDISNKLLEIDKDNNYYITIKSSCYINELPQERTDVISIKYKNDKQKTYNTSSKPNLDKKHCEMDLDNKPINLILPFAGISLHKIMKINRKDTDNIKAKIHQLFITNIKVYFKHLLIGLAKMHQIKLVNRDIKQKNLMIYVEPQMVPKLNTMDLMQKNPDILNIMKLRYIDFGLTTFITSSLSKDINNIYLSGTYRYLAPEMLISYILVKYKNRDLQYKLQQINEKVKYVKESLDRIEEKKMISTLKDDIAVLYKKLQYLYDTDKLRDKYFGTNTTTNYNSYLQKADVYALGITIFDTLQSKKNSNLDVRKNHNLYSLLLKMIEIDPDNRFNVIQCINHEYFK